MDQMDQWLASLLLSTSMDNTKSGRSASKETRHCDASNVRSHHDILHVCKCAFTRAQLAPATNDKQFGLRELARGVEQEEREAPCGTLFRCVVVEPIQAVKSKRRCFHNKEFHSVWSDG